MRLAICIIRIYLFFLLPCNPFFSLLTTDMDWVIVAPPLNAWVFHFANNLHRVVSIIFGYNFLEMPFYFSTKDMGIAYLLTSIYFPDLCLAALVKSKMNVPLVRQTAIEKKVWPAFSVANQPITMHCNYLNSVRLFGYISQTNSLNQSIKQVIFSSKGIRN